jgi:hypothetical protein
MRTSSTTITHIGRRSDCGRCTRRLLIGLLSGWFSIALGAGAAPGEAIELSDAQVHAAKIRARTTVCEEETPAVAAHLEQAYSDWLDRNPAIAQEALHSLYFGLDAEARLAAYEALRQRLEKELRRQLQAHPEAFANECNEFFSDLTAGALDFP